MRRGCIVAWFSLLALVFPALALGATACVPRETYVDKGVINGSACPLHPSLHSQTIKNPDLLKLQLALGLDNDTVEGLRRYKVKEIITTFHNIEYKKLPLIEMRLAYVLDASSVPSEVHSQAAQHIDEHPECQLSHKLQAPHAGVAGDQRNLNVSMEDKATIFSCSKWRWVCCEDWKCRTCEKVMRTELFPYDFVLKGSLAPVVTPDCRDLTIESDNFKVVEDKGVQQDIKNLLTNIVGVISLNILSKWFNDNWRASLRKINKNIPSIERSVMKAGKSSSEVSWYELLRFYDDQRTGFRSSPGGLEFVATYHFEYPPASFCFFGAEIANFLALLRSTTLDLQTAHSVGPGDTLWRIAESNYGDGRYFHVLLSANPKLRDTPNKLPRGQRIEVPPMYKILESRSDLVEYGDSLWKLAEEKLGNGLRWRELSNSNKNWSKSPSIIYPLQHLLGPASSGRQP